MLIDPALARAFGNADPIRRREMVLALMRAGTYARARAAEVAAATATKPAEAARLAAVAHRMLRCAHSLSVYRPKPKASEDPDITRLTVTHKRACNLPAYCDLCARRDARKKGRAFKPVVARIQAEAPGTPFLLVTLTVPNVAVDQLGAALDHLEAAEARLQRMPAIKAALTGRLIASEITFPRDELGQAEAHPHLHALWAVRPDYFDRDKDLYVSQARLTELWSEAAGAPKGVSYIVDIRRVRDAEGRVTDVAVSFALAECVKYQCKGSDVSPVGPRGPEADPAIIAALVSATFRRRRIRVSGVFAAARKAINKQTTEAAP